MPKDTKLTSYLPPIFLSRMRALLADDYPAFVRSNSLPSKIGLRVNTLKLSASEFQAHSPFTLSSIPWCPSGFILPPDTQPGKHPYHAAGLYYLQEPSAMAVAEILAPNPGERVLDLSAAPGGKTTHLAALMQNQGLLVANEIHSLRAWDLAENLERCGIRIAAITNETPQRLALHFNSFFDRVLVDAPCSGEGMFRKSQAARSQWTPEYVRNCALRQQEILHTASQLLRPGGTLVYSTCTFAPQENEAVIGRFLQSHPDFILNPVPESPGFSSGMSAWVPHYAHYPLEHTVRIWPHQTCGDGHFIACMQRLNDSADNVLSDSPPHPAEHSPLPPQLALQFHTFLIEALTSVDFDAGLFLSGSYLYHLPPGQPCLPNLKYIHPGWWLGVFKKDRFEPSHTLALGLTASQAQRTCALTAGDPALLAFLHGESLPSTGENGWTLVTVDGFPIGWGKRVRSTLKNAYPHGLRWR